MTTAERPANGSVRFKRHLSAQVVDGDAVYLFSERKVTVLAGGQIEAVAPLLDGTRDLEALLREVDATSLSRAEVTRLIERLTAAGLLTICEPDAPADDTEHAYWEASGLDAARAVVAANAPVALTMVGALDEAEASSAFTSAGLSVVQDGGALSVVLCDDYLAPELKEIDETHRVSGRPWLLARPVGERLWIGPVFEPGTAASACWHCLADRLLYHRPAEAHVKAALGVGRVTSTAVTLPALRTAAYNLIALEAVKWLAGHRYPGQRCVWTFDSADLHGRTHPVQRRPQCSCCGDPTLMRVQARRPIVLRPRRKFVKWGADHRTMSPEQVIENFRHVVSPISGVVKEVTRCPAGPKFLNVFLSGPPPAGSPRTVKGLQQSMRFQNGGKGITPLHAEASALCEALERYSGRFQGDEETVVASFASLRDQAIHPNTCQLYHERQYADRERWNRGHSAFQFVAERFNEQAEVPWTPVWSYTEQRHKYLPTNMLYFGVPRAPGAPAMRADSNGCAAGTSLEDAVLQGLLELIERDAVAIWWYNRTTQPGVDLDAFGESWLDEVRDGYDQLGRELWVLDLTTDLGVPAMAALSRVTGGPEQRVAFGFGAHLDPRIALRRAVTEMNQLIPSLHEQGAVLDSDVRRWCRDAAVETHPYLVASEVARMPSDYGYRRCDDLHADVQLLHEIVRGVGLELLMLNQSRPDIGMPVVRVIVPGLRHFWARLAPGRLYDIPVLLGRLEKPTLYENLNPYPMFL